MIEINNLSKSYGINKIFENESITLTNSCIYALVGVNGIGKSTFLNSIIQPSTLDKGSVKIDDIPSTDFTAKYHYAFVPDTKDMFLNLTGKEYLQFVSELYNQKDTKIEVGKFIRTNYFQLFSWNETKNISCRSFHVKCSKHYFGRTV